jgi:hypothetical protein
VNRLGEGSADQGGWHSVLVGPASLTDVVIVGSGKEADILIALATRLDDRNVEIRYSGPGLVARSVRVRYDPRDPEWQDEFHEDLRAWLASDSSDEFNYCVDADIVLAAEGSDA